MKKNVGKTDRIARVALAAIIAGVGLYYQSWFGLIAIVPLTTAFLAWCPVYLPFGMSTCKLTEEKK